MKSSWVGEGYGVLLSYFRLYILSISTSLPWRKVERSKMEADRSGGGPNPNSGGGGSSGAGRNPNGPKAAPGQATASAAAGGMAAAVAAAGAGAVPGLQPRESQDGDAALTLPGILHFIQYEWGRFQAEKYRWEAERDELRVNLLTLIVRM